MVRAGSEIKSIGEDAITDWLIISNAYTAESQIAVVLLSKVCGHADC